MSAWTAPLSRRDRLRARAAPALLLALALVQLVLVAAQDLSAWRGGGFGMFSTTEHAGWRHLRLAVEPPGEAAPQRVAVTPATVRAARRAKAHPSRDMLRRLGRQVLAAHPEAAAVHVTLERTRFDPETLEPRREPLARLRVPRRGAAR